VNSTSSTEPDVDQAAIRRVVIASSVGTVIEWYDFALYGAASALIFAPLFFPNESPLIGMLASFAVFALAFLVRPFGGFVVSHFGDRIGRKPMLIFTVVLMGASTVAIGLLPTYESIGIWAPILLVITRLLQGFGAGAEYAGAVTMVAEYAPQHKRAFYTSFSQAAVAVAFFLSMGAFTAIATLPEEQLLGWAWRIPFLASVAIFFCAVFIRRRVGETPEFLKARAAEAQAERKTTSLPIIQVFKENSRGLLIGFFSGSGINAGGYLINTFALSYITNTLELPRNVAVTAMLTAAAVTAFTVPMFGALADRIGRRQVLMGGAAFMALYAVPFFLLLDTKSTPVIILAMTVGYAVGCASMQGAQAAFLSELFETRYRFSGIAASRELNAMLLAGPTPFIATALVATAGGEPWLVATFLIVTTLTTVIAMYVARNHEEPQPMRTDNTLGAIR
jgi:MFS transporter, MHS family, shikimate and dehydroshikimate transport protein